MREEVGSQSSEEVIGQLWGKQFGFLGWKAEVGRPLPVILSYEDD